MLPAMKQLLIRFDLEPPY